MAASLEEGNVVGNVECKDLIHEDTPLLPEKGKRHSRNPLDGKPECEAGALESLNESLTGYPSLSKHFDKEFLFAVATSQGLLKGFAGTLTGASQMWLFDSYNVAGPNIQVFNGVTAIPWASKPILGIISDSFPIMGYNKLPYMLITLMLGIGGSYTIARFPKETLDITQVVTCLFLISLMYAAVDLLTEASYAAKIRAKPEHGPSMMAFVLFSHHSCALVGLAVVGLLISHFDSKAPYIVAMVPMFLAIIPVVRNSLGERRKTPEEVAEARKGLLEQKEALILCLAMFVCTLTLTLVGIFVDNVALNAALAACAGLIILGCFSLVLRPITARVNAFSLIQASLSLSISGAAFYFYIDGPEEYPEGPHFTKQFFTSVLGVLGTACSIVGIWTYRRFGQHWTYQRLFISMNIILSLLSLADVVMFKRWNVKWGIPDKAFILGATVCKDIIIQWMWMPALVLMSQLCPEGMEATMFALLAGCHNLGGIISSNIGALVLQWLKCNPKGLPNESAQFENLWLASLISTVLPLFTVLLIPYMIPDAKQTDRLLADGDRDATKGSLLKRWMGEHRD